MRPSSSRHHHNQQQNAAVAATSQTHARRRTHLPSANPSGSTAISLFDDDFATSTPPSAESNNPQLNTNKPAPKPEKPPPPPADGFYQQPSNNSLVHNLSVPDWSKFTNQLSNFGIANRLTDIAFREFAQSSEKSSTDDISDQSGVADSLNVYTVQQIACLSEDEMPCRERTAEFRTTAKSLQMKQQAAVQMNGVKQHNNKHVQQSLQFNQHAKRIGRDLSQTCAKLEKMAELAKRRSVFDENAGEQEQLTAIIKQDITALNKQITLLHDVSAARREEASSKQNTNHSKSVVVGLQSRLACVSNEFKSILETRTETLKAARSRRDKFGESLPVPSSMPPSASSGNMGSVLLMDEAQASSSAGGYYANAGGAVALDMDIVQRTRQEQQQLLANESEAYLSQRADAMQNIESHIVELGQIFRQLASLVSEQGETIQRIDSNVEDVSLNVEAAHMELLKYFRHISNNRWLALKVFGILIVFFIFFIVFLT